MHTTNAWRLGSAGSNINYSGNWDWLYNSVIAGRWPSFVTVRTYGQAHYTRP